MERRRFVASLWVGADYSAFKFVRSHLQMPDVPGFGLSLTA